MLLAAMALGLLTAADARSHPKGAAEQRLNNLQGTFREPSAGRSLVWKTRPGCGGSAPRAGAACARREGTGPKEAWRFRILRERHR